MKALLVTDLDGTLLRDDKTVSPENLSTLKMLGEKGIIRAIATGRSVYSACRVLPDDFPVDYLIFSSGAGWMEWMSKAVEPGESLNPEQVEIIIEYLLAQNVDFMVHDPVPENHRFQYFLADGGNSDFHRRIRAYEAYSRAIDPASFTPDKACQFVVVLGPGERERYETIAGDLKDQNVVMRTSPMDGNSIWVEVFPKKVSKASGAESVAKKHGIPRNAVAAIGNDYNDLQLLSWAETKFAVANAPEELKAMFTVVPSNNDNGFTRGVELWLRDHEPG